jgi:outer membrane protein assembly factor BamB
MLLVMAFGISAQEPIPLIRRVALPGESIETAARLQAADRMIETTESPGSAASLPALAVAPFSTPLLLAASSVVDQTLRQDWSAALEEYQRIISDDGDALVLQEGTDPRSPTAHSLAARRLCHLRIAAAPPHALALYQKRVDGLAEKLFREGDARRDSAALHRLVDDFFCSRFTDRALDLLGDRAFERGDFVAAVQWWRLLTLPASDVPTGGELRFPRPQVDLARVRAKFILAAAFDGETEQADRELRAFRVLHGSARGKLAGKEGNYASIVEEVIRHLPSPEGDSDWSTFAGNPSRNRVLVSSPSPRSWAGGPTWRVSLPSSGSVDVARPFSHLAARLYYHPVIVGDRVLLTDGRSVFGYNLLNGRLLFRHDLQSAGKAALDPSSSDGTPPAPRFTLSVAGERVYARLGELAIGPVKTPGQSFLVCLEMPAGKDHAKPGQLREVWSVASSDESLFEGAPLIHDGLAYSASSRVENRRTKTSLHCYDAATGKQRWHQEICDTPEFEGAATTRYQHHLLTLAGDNIVYCSHSGAIVAVGRGNGKQAWAVRYPGQKLEAGEKQSVRDLCPCVFHWDRLFAAPADSDRIFCLDSSSGQILWDESIKGLSLVGVARGRLILTEPRGLRALRARTGADAWQQPKGQNPLLNLGRGLLAGDQILWPTRNPRQAVFVVHQTDGEQPDINPTEMRQIQAGNMAFGNGCLVVAGTDYLFGYVAPGRLLQRPQAGAASPQASVLTATFRKSRSLPVERVVPLGGK